MLYVTVQSSSQGSRDVSSTLFRVVGRCKVFLGANRVRLGLSQAARCSGLPPCQDGSMFENEISESTARAEFFLGFLVDHTYKGIDALEGMR